MSTLIPQDVLKKRRQAFLYFIKKYPNTPIDVVEDFASFCTIQWYKGRKMNTAIKFLAVDFLRTKLRYTDEEVLEAKKNGKTLRGTKDALGGKENLGLNIEIHGKRVTYAIRETILTTLNASKLSTLERAIVILKTQWGFTFKEIGHVFGLSEGRICQMERSLVGLLKTANKKR